MAVQDIKAFSNEAKAERATCRESAGLSKDPRTAQAGERTRSQFG